LETKGAREENKDWHSLRNRTLLVFWMVMVKWRLVMMEVWGCTRGSQVEWVRFRGMVIGGGVREGSV
jgi:hypothetical protein